MDKVLQGLAVWGVVIGALVVIGYAITIVESAREAFLRFLVRWEASPRRWQRTFSVVCEELISNWFLKLLLLSVAVLFMWTTLIARRDWSTNYPDAWLLLFIFGILPSISGLAVWFLVDTANSIKRLQLDPRSNASYIAARLREQEEQRELSVRQAAHGKMWDEERRMAAREIERERQASLARWRDEWLGTVARGQDTETEESPPLLKISDWEVGRRLQRHEALDSTLPEEEKSEVPPSRRGQLELEVERLIRLDPANLAVEANDLQRQFRASSKDQLQERSGRLARELQELRRAREEAKKQVQTIEGQQQALDSRRREAERRLQELERTDPANVGAALRSLRERWRGMSQAELEAVPARSEIERLLRDDLLLERQIQPKDEQAEALRRMIDDPLAEAILLLEAYMIERERLDRNIQPDVHNLS